MWECLCTRKREHVHLCVRGCSSGSRSRGVCESVDGSGRVCMWGRDWAHTFMCVPVRVCDPTCVCTGWDVWPGTRVHACVCVECTVLCAL